MLLYMHKTILILTLTMAASIAIGQNTNETMEKNKNDKNKTENHWKQELTTEQYQVLRQCGTEPAFS